MIFRSEPRRRQATYPRSYWNKWHRIFMVTNECFPQLIKKAQTTILVLFLHSLISYFGHFWKRLKSLNGICKWSDLSYENHSTISFHTWKIMLLLINNERMLFLIFLFSIYCQYDAFTRANHLVLQLRSNSNGNCFFEIARFFTMHLSCKSL